MSNSYGEVLYAKGMQISDQDSESDMWNDAKLNAAYDKALQIANREVKRRELAKNEHHSGDSQSIADKTSTSTSSKDHSKTSSSNPKWTAGMPCRAIYDGDGVEYEAFILRNLNDKECIIRYLGYENAEIASIDSLKPSHGKDERLRQIQMTALQQERGETSRGRNNLESIDHDIYRETTSPDIPDKSTNNRKKSNRKKSQTGLNSVPTGFPLHSMKNMGSMNCPMPPPMPFVQLQGCGSNPESEDPELAPVLISWYMSGFYTGLYQGMKRTKPPSSRKQ